MTVSAQTDLDTAGKRKRMLAGQLRARGIQDPLVLQAMGEVPREEFVAPELVEFAYEDTPLPIDESQTISQPFIVARMIQALELREDDRVLEVGTGSGYAAAVLSRIVDEVFTIERHGSLARSAEERCRRLGYDNVHVRHGDGSLGWPEEAPFDAIVVAAGGPEVPEPLRSQLAVGGRLVIPVGPTPRVQELVRIRRPSKEREKRETLEAVRFVPLVGEAGWEGSPAPETPSQSSPGPDAPTYEWVRHYSQAFSSIDDADLAELLERIGDARVVCLGEASHGTAEFYEMRARITRELAEKKGFTVVAVEADWPDAQRIDAQVRETRIDPDPEKAFSRFPTWMWANKQVLEFVEDLREINGAVSDPERRVGFYGLDLYSLHRSIQAVLRYLDDVYP